MKITENTINIAAKQYANQWDVDNGTKKLIIEAYKKGAIDIIYAIKEILNL